MTIFANIPSYAVCLFLIKVLTLKVQVGKDQEKAQSEKDSHSKNRGGKVDISVEKCTGKFDNSESYLVW